MRAWSAGVVVALAFPVGCQFIAGVGDPMLRQSDGGGDSGKGEDGGQGAIATKGEPCAKTGDLACAGPANNSALVCGADMKWIDHETCPDGKLCDTGDGMHPGTCQPVVPACAGKSPSDVVCGDGQDQTKNQTQPTQCGPDLVTAHEFAKCMDGQICSAGVCVEPASCVGLKADCGPGGDEYCCTSLFVPGGTFNRSNDASTPATVSNFRLDRFEITVGRFRAFVSAWVDGWRPNAGTGKHTHLVMGGLNGGMEPGWDTTWSTTMNFPANKMTWDASLICISGDQTWTPDAEMNENLPANCVNWYQAYAFCIWDGGFLPSEAEWNYVAAGGSLQGQYPWGDMTPDPTYAVFDCTGDGSAPGVCAFADILRVGSKSMKGDGKWGQADLAGEVSEWNLDWVGPYPNPDSCDDCANLQLAPARAARGGSYNTSASTLLSSYRGSSDPTGRDVAVGARCARAP